ncbi:uncharacterized protein LOC101899891 isoform X2 [Musca domestica]|uniref:Uncharacterized protein LOC101899891 isoform X2 n=1 Tax=Musca domestica TaxID=7370 RepID=A0A1I8MQH7_MUSDO|nr:uncharacterized protein LOC101899891 isoform X2 [Musca domestica]
MEAFNAGNILAHENDYSSSCASDVDELSPYGLEKYVVVSPFAVSSDERTKIATRKRNGEERMPTRRPDPKVYNRNALLARENRRKKKLYLESLEREVQEARLANRNLVKALKRQISLTKKLEQRTKYYQNIIANKAEISSLLSILESQKSTRQSICHDQTSNCSYGEQSTDLEPDNNDMNDCRSSLDDLLWNINCEASSEATLSSSETSNVFDEHSYGITSSSSEAQSSPDFSATYNDFNWNEDIGFLATTTGSCMHLNRGQKHLLGCAF